MKKGTKSSHKSKGSARKAPNKVSGPSGGMGPKKLTGKMNKRMY